MSSLVSGEVVTPVPYVVHGSFRKHLDVIQSTITTLNETGRAVAIAPHDCTTAYEQDGFVILSGEQDKDPRQIEAEYLQKVLSLRALGGFSLWVASNGYVGKSAAYEYGIAQACGVPSFFTEPPEDVPFYVHPESIKSPEELAGQLQQNPSLLTRLTINPDRVGQIWERLPFPTASVAVGGIVRHRKRLLLAEDGRWPDNQLTVPGTSVRARETRDSALQRALTDKFGVNASDVSPLKTSFMLDGSGYGKPIDSLVFDDRIIDLSSERAEPQTGLVVHWVSPAEAQTLAETGQVEPNTASLVNEYLARAA
jgi:hypothetical protein